MLVSGDPPSGSDSGMVVADPEDRVDRSRVGQARDPAGAQVWELICEQCLDRVEVDVD